MNRTPPKPPQPGEKPTRRPFGPFLLFTAALLLLLVVFGPSSSTRDISEDEFWYRLYSGQLQSVVLSGTNRITGTLTKAASTTVDSVDKFSLVVASTEKIGERVRSAAAKDLERSLTMSTFLADVTSETILPLRGYPIRVKKKNPGEETHYWSQRYFVDYQDKDGLHYAEIIEPDPVSISVALQTAGAEIEEGLVFDLDDKKGMKTEEGYSFFSAFLYSFGPILLLIALFWFIFMRQMRGQGQGLMSFGRSRATLYNKEKQTNVNFGDVAGIDEAKEEVSEIIEFLRSTRASSRGSVGASRAACFS